MTPVAYLSTADDDLLDIYLTIGQENEPAARRVIDRIRSALRRLSDFPHSAPEQPEVAVDARSMAIGNYVALYRVMPDEVQIVRVVHTARDLSAFANDFAQSD